ncbi:MAG TPA: MYXO-CTERM sorting domain-containing protein [Kofleriaceae bacterium]|nr:MYXO-CTERM sorting domain-containing protein [Kofleriaceae bacterium]
MVLAAHAAEADCVYRNGYYDPFLRGACGVETMVPEGCPIHVATPAGTPPVATVFRGTDMVDVSAQVQVVDTISVPMEVVDPNDCDCARNPGARAFDRDAVTITGAKAGDVVSFQGSQLENGGASVTIDAAGPCPAPTWPTQFHVATQCDRCPTPPGDNPGGCSSTSGGGALAVVVVLMMLARRRRRQGRTARRGAGTAAGDRTDRPCSRAA